MAFSYLDQLQKATLVDAEESSLYRFRSPFRFQKLLRVFNSVCSGSTMKKLVCMLKLNCNGVMKEGSSIISSVQEITMGLEIYS